VAIIMGQATVPASNTVPIFTVPPSYSAVTFYSLSAQATYIGTSTAVTTSNGMVCHSLPTSFNAFIGSKGVTFYATTGNATAATVNYIISTNF
jgi:hypothetical protein